MGFILGIVLGILMAIGLCGFLAYWVCTKADHIALAKAINGLAQALAHRPKSPEQPATPGKLGKAVEKR